jgi:lysophospholipase L1-like esterase
MICSNPHCNFNTICGRSKGFGWLVNPSELNKKDAFINSSRNNVSHDLRLIFDINNISKSMNDKGQRIFNTLPHQYSRPFFDLFQIIYYEKDHGTREVLQGIDENKIYNINDALKYIIDLVKVLPKIEYNRFGFDKIGDVNVYDDGRDIVYNPI